MLKRVLVHKAREGKINAHWNLKRRLTTFALSMVLLFTGSSGAIYAQGAKRDQESEAHKRRLEKRREAQDRIRGNILSSSSGKGREAKKRGRGNIRSSSSSIEPEVRKHALGNSLSGSP